MKSTTGGQTHFARIPSANIQRSKMNRSHGVKTTFDASYLIPIYADEALPGDTFNLRMANFTRMATPIHPIMDNLYLETFFFAVPIRLLWNNWERFNGAQDAPGDSTDYMTPIVTTPPGGHPPFSVFDYMGLPIGKDDVNPVAFHFRAMNLIYNEWFRDENLCDPASMALGDGPDLSIAYPLRRRGKRHDYFTSCLPWPQKGPAVTLPLGTTAPVVGTGSPFFNFAGGDIDNIGADASGNVLKNSLPQPTGQAALTWASNTGLEADLTNATSATINALRESFQIQRLYERDARGGTRYTETLKSHFGVTSPDSRLQRPEFLGGGSQQINFSVVPQTSETVTTPQGNLAAYATSGSNNHGFNKSFTEHCVILGFANVRADLNYQEGKNKMWSRRTRWDYYWPTLAHLGEQSVLSGELEFTGVPGTDDLVFGYQERYAEYRYKPSMITGAFRSSFAQSLDVWHLAQDFGGVPPVLNQTFIEEDVPIDRVIAVPSEPQFLFDAFFQITCARPMPTYGVPGLIDHF